MESRTAAGFRPAEVALIQFPALRLADVSKPFRVHTDASSSTIVAVLTQVVDDGWKLSRLWQIVFTLLWKERP